MSASEFEKFDRLQFAVTELEQRLQAAEERINNLENGVEDIVRDYE